MFGPNWEEVTESWKQQHDTELHYLHSSPNGDRSSTVVKVLCYKSEDRWFWNFSLT